MRWTLAQLPDDNSLIACRLSNSGLIIRWFRITIEFSTLEIRLNSIYLNDRRQSKFDALRLRCRICNFFLLSNNHPVRLNSVALLGLIRLILLACKAHFKISSLPRVIKFHACLLKTMDLRCKFPPWMIQWNAVTASLSIKILFHSKTIIMEVKGRWMVTSSLKKSTSSEVAI